MKVSGKKEGELGTCVASKLNVIPKAMEATEPLS